MQQVGASVLKDAPMALLGVACLPSVFAAVSAKIPDFHVPDRLLANITWQARKGRGRCTEATLEVGLDSHKAVGHPELVVPG